MLGKLLSKKDKDSNKEHQEILNRLSKMNISEMRLYVNNKLKDFQICEDGLSEVMSKLISKNEQTGVNFIGDDAMDTKIKKAFDLVILVAGSKKITVTAIESMNKFMEIYAAMIQKFDVDNKQTYDSKLKKAIDISIKNVAIMSEIQKKNNILGK